MASKDFLKGLKGVLPFWFGSEILLEKCGSKEATECSSRDGEGTKPCGDNLTPPSFIPLYWPFKRRGRGRAEHLGCGVFVSLSVSAPWAAAAERISGGQVGQKKKNTRISSSSST